MVPSRLDLSSEVLPRRRSDLRLCCAMCAADPGTARQLLESREESVDWLALIEAAKSYRLEMLLHRAVDAHFADFVSPPARQALRSLYADNLARGQAMTAELLHLLGRLASAQIPAIAFKGPVLGAQLFGDLGLRIYGDLDLLVRERDIAQVTTIMVDLGYQQGAMSLGWERSFMRAGGAGVDVHWSISDKLHQFPLNADELWARRTTTAFGATRVPALCAEDTLLMVCFNGLTEDWQRCDRIADIAELMRDSSAIEWPKFLDMCRRRGCERLVLVGLHLAKELFLVKLPNVVELRLASHRKALGRAGYTIDDFIDFMVTSTQRRSGLDYWRHVIRMRERLWQKIPYFQSFAYSVFKPKDDDAPWQRTTRQVLYRVLRLPLLGVKHGLRVVGHASLKQTDNRP